MSLSLTSGSSRKRHARAGAASNRTNGRTRSLLVDAAAQYGHAAKQQGESADRRRGIDFRRIEMMLMMSRLVIPPVAPRAVSMSLGCHHDSRYRQQQGWN